MNMTNQYDVVLIDDEIHCNESLGLLLAACCPQVNIKAKFNTPREALTWLKSNRADLVFLDIEMPGMSGFDLLARTEGIDFDVIFVTAYDQYAIKAFHYSAISYLLKPVDQEDLRVTLDRWIKKKDKTITAGQLGLMYELLRDTDRHRRRIALPTSDGLEFIEIRNIVRCESDSNYTRIFCTGKEQHLICRTLKEVENVLGECGFLRIHHSHLVNPSYIRKLVRNSGGYIVMEDQTQIPFSKSRKDRLYELLSYVERI